jgi:glycosyltransferase involved in cell wall biosynthesis
MFSKISACLVLFNEEKKIRKCLESIKDLVDEIVVIHDGQCQDRTIEICREFGAKIYFKNFIGNPEYHRIDLLKKAKNNWILQIDADEVLSEELRKEILKLKFDKDAYLMKRLAKDFKFRKYCLRLFNKKKIKFIGLVHHEAELLNSSSSQKLKNPIYHYKDKEKFYSDKWFGIQARERIGQKV